MTKKEQEKLEKFIVEKGFNLADDGNEMLYDYSKFKTIGKLEISLCLTFNDDSISLMTVTRIKGKTKSEYKTEDFTDFEKFKKEIEKYN